MRIELNSGGLDGLISIESYQMNMNGYITGAEYVAESFVAVQKATQNLNGGIGVLQDAFTAIGVRHQIEVDRKENAERIFQETNSFLDLASQIDKQVAADVKKNRNQFYGVYPWLKPKYANIAKKWITNAWNYLNGKLLDGVAKVTETSKKIVASISKFYEDNKDKIIKSIITVALAAFTIAGLCITIGMSGGALAVAFSTLGLVPKVAAAIAYSIEMLAALSTLTLTEYQLSDLWKGTNLQDTKRYKIAKIINNFTMVLSFSMEGFVQKSLQAAATSISALYAAEADSISILIPSSSEHYQEAQQLNFIMSTLSFFTSFRNIGTDINELAKGAGDWTVMPYSSKGFNWIKQWDGFDVDFTQIKQFRDIFVQGSNIANLPRTESEQDNSNYSHQIQ